MNSAGAVDDRLAVAKLIEDAQLAINTAIEDPDLFSNRIDSYLSALDAWRANLEERYPGGLSEHPQREELKIICSELQGLHSQVLARANATRESVSDAMGSLRHRAISLKVYVDKLPQRITITGRREG